MRIIFIVTLLLLTSCSFGNLAASLTGGGIEHTFTETYEVRGEQHTITFTFTIAGDVIENLEIETGAVTPKEETQQIVFSANVRQYILMKNVEDISLPNTVGIGADALRITEVFRGVVEELQR